MRRLLVFAIAALVPLGCFSLDGFSGGGPKDLDLDGGDAEASSLPTVVAEAAAETSTSEEAATTPDYASVVMGDQPAAYYRLEDPVGTTTVHDETGQHPGQTYGSLVFGVKGAVGNAADFHNGGFGLGDLFDFHGLSEFTIEFWEQNDHPTDDYEAPLKKRFDNDVGAQDGWIVFLEKDNQTLQFQFWKDGAVNEETGTDTSVTGMHHVAIVRTTSTQSPSLAMYLDGVLQAANANTGSGDDEPGTSQGLTVGADFHGIIDEVAFYQHPLTVDRLLLHVQAAQTR